ncbi:M24 family metallopeptidase [Pseudomonas asplenii]|uniref:M24 family metallopeptidase n=1 Tax=Pseudomonas asplenii TaxID=53407 RepID=UPI000361D0C6|nr:M24 family metallopeptidase [Pseudomonas fuscovaginae]
MGLLSLFSCLNVFAAQPSLEHYEAGNRAFGQGIAELDDGTILEEERRLAPLASELLLGVKPMIRQGGNGMAIQAYLLGQFKQNGWQPMLVGYHGYPSAVPVSVNNQVANAQPTETAFPEAALVKVELVAASSRAHVAQAWTFATPNATEQQRRLLAAARSALQAGISRVRAGERVASIGEGIQEVLDANRMVAVHELAGYGMGAIRVQKPQVLGYKGVKGIAPSGDLMQVGQVLNVYVIAKDGAFGVRYAPPDFWTLLTTDGADSVMLSAMVEVTADGHRVLGRLLD